jgi:hypothetical protein
MISTKLSSHFVGAHYGQVQGKTQFGPSVCGTVRLMPRTKKHV